MKIRCDRVNYYLVIIYYSLAYLSDVMPYGNILLAADLALILFNYMKANGSTIRIAKSILIPYTIAFAAFCCSSRIWAENPALTIPKSNAMIFVTISIIVLCSTQYKMIDLDDFLRAIMYGGYIVATYILVVYGLGRILTAVSGGNRMSNELINSNTLGMCVAYSLLISIYYIIYEKKLQPGDMFMIPGFIMLFASGSRKAFVIIILGAFAIFALKNYNGKDSVRSLIKVTIIVAFLALGLYLLLKLPIFALINQRMEALFTVLRGEGTRRTSGWIRMAYNKLGLEIFKKHPLLGIGLGNANIYTMQAYGKNHYLHNNYVELLATLGLIGTFLYYSIYVYILVLYIRNLRKRDRYLDICLIILLIRLIMDYGAVVFYGKSTYVFLLLLVMNAERVKRWKGESAPSEIKHISSDDPERNSFPESVESRF